MRRALRLGVGVLVVVVIGWVLMTRAGLVDGPAALDPGTASSDPAAASPAPTDDYFSIVGKAQHPYTPKRTGDVEYCSLDRAHRPVCAYGNLTAATRDAAQRRGREQIDVDPPGWGHNGEVDIPATATKGSRPYHGWMWNRSHLLADSLGGEPVEANLVTGTRTQNVGSTQVDGQYAGGMAHTETIARDYLDSAHAKDCPLYYAATAHYTGAESIPRTVTVDIRSCDGSVDQHVLVSNTAQGFSIDYTTGRFTRTG